MLIFALTALQDAISGAWGVDTCDPRDLPHWRPDNPARGQCGFTALVVNDLLGGDVLLAEVRNADGTRQGVHYWNRISTIELDLTREQFTDGEVVGPATVVKRPPGAPRLFPERYELLRARTLAALAS